MASSDLESPMHDDGHMVLGSCLVDQHRSACRMLYGESSMENWEGKMAERRGGKFTMAVWTQDGF